MPTSNDPISIGGLHGYFGTIELVSAGDGIVVVDRLSLERYLLGLAEVPLTWPPEALKAQAIAARTYALYTLGRPAAGAAAIYGFDICASVQCQVFAGADIVRAPSGNRWAAGVEVTAGETVVYEGRPILARYHSTSGGSTLANPQAFPGEIDYPYLRPVSSTTEEASPLYRWTAVFPVRDLQQILTRAGVWQPQLGRLLEARSVPSSQGLHYPDIVFRGRGSEARRSAEDVRDILRDFAPAMFPNKYPSSAPTTSGRLPETLPSNRVEVTTEGRNIIVSGRGWGHGVGMSQWGAHGLAESGASYRDILEHYYSNTSIATVPTDRPIEVGVAWGLEEVTASGAFSIVDGRGRVLVKRALGDWRFNFAGAGAVAVDPPVGFGLPLEIGIVKAPRSVEMGQSVELTIALSRPARVRAVTLGVAAREGEGVVRSAGRRTVRWSAPKQPGAYDVVVRASTGSAVKSSGTVAIEVREVVRPDTRSELIEDGRPSRTLVWTAIALLVVAAGGILYAGRIPS